MNHCLHYEAQIDAFVDTMLSEEEEKALFAHISECESCLQLLIFTQEMKKAADCLYVDAPPELCERIMCRIESNKNIANTDGTIGEKKPRQVVAFIRPIALLAVCAAFVLLIFGSNDIMKYMVPEQTSLFSSNEPTDSTVSIAPVNEEDVLPELAYGTKDAIIDQFSAGKTAPSRSERACVIQRGAFTIHSGLNSVITNPSLASLKPDQPPIAPEASAYTKNAAADIQLAEANPVQAQPENETGTKNASADDVPIENNTSIQQSIAAAEPHDPALSGDAAPTSQYGLNLVPVQEKPDVSIDGTFQRIVYTTLAESLPEALAAYRVERVAKVHYLVIPVVEFDSVLNALQDMPITVYVYTGTSVTEKNATQVLFIVTIE